MWKIQFHTTWLLSPQGVITRELNTIFGGNPVFDFLTELKYGLTKTLSCTLYIHSQLVAIGLFMCIFIDLSWKTHKKYLPRLMFLSRVFDSLRIISFLLFVLSIFLFTMQWLCVSVCLSNSCSLIATCNLNAFKILWERVSKGTGGRKTNSHQLQITRCWVNTLFSRLRLRHFQLRVFFLNWINFFGQCFMFASE